MSRTERINKLGRAIKEYRGAFNQSTGKWLPGRCPKLPARARIVAHLEALKLDVDATMTKIDGFKHGNEFRAWIKTL